MNEILLAKYGEIALKGLNRGAFEQALLKTIRRRMALAGTFKVTRAQSTIYVEPQDDGCDIGRACTLLQCVFGIAAVNRAWVVDKQFEAICQGTERCLGPQLAAAKTFRVSARRADKTFPLNSMQIATQLGGVILEKFPHLRVDLDHPDCHVVVEIRETAAYIHGGPLEAAGGLPAGTGGRAAVMLSGGIDSPVAAYMMAKRGMDLVGVHFMSPPYTGERALDKVVRLARRLSDYTGHLPLLCVPFTDIQLAIRDGAPEEFFTVLMRRAMLRITVRLCEKEHCGAVITGESLGQVASQTLEAIACTDAVSTLPVLRPAIGMDKTEIVSLARRIGTFDISIEPYEDCCTIFTPRHPKTKPRLADIERAEAAIPNLFALEAQAAESYTIKMLHFFD